MIYSVGALDECLIIIKIRICAMKLEDINVNIAGKVLGDIRMLMQIAGHNT